MATSGLEKSTGGFTWERQRQRNLLGELHVSDRLARFAFSQVPRPLDGPGTGAQARVCLSPGPALMG